VQEDEEGEGIGGFSHACRPTAAMAGSGGETPKLGSTLTQSKAQVGAQGSASRSGAACVSVAATVEH
jgi:hypothetical protein